MTATATTTTPGTGTGNDIDVDRTSRKKTRHSHQWVLVSIDAKYQTSRKLHKFRQDCFEHFSEEELVQIQDCRDGGHATTTTTTTTTDDDDENDDDASFISSLSMRSMRSISSSITSMLSLSSRRRRSRRKHTLTVAGTMIPAQISSPSSSSPSSVSPSWDDDHDMLLDDSLSPSEDEECASASQKSAATSEAWRYLQELEEEHSFDEETLDALRLWFVQ